MGKKLQDENQRITQKSIGFYSRQVRWMSENPNFKIDKFCRKVADEQIKLSGQEQFL